jgi:hypothetical protein
VFNPASTSGMLVFMTVSMQMANLICATVDGFLGLFLDDVLTSSILQSMRVKHQRATQELACTASARPLHFEENGRHQILGEISLASN